MPEDRVTITADGSQYFDVLRRAGVAADRFAGSGDRIGAGFVRGERVIRTASANIAGALTMSGDAATTVLVAMQGLERVFAIGIGPTIAVAAGVKAFEVLHEQIKKTNEAYKDLKDSLDALEKPAVSADVQKAQDKIDELTKKVKTLQDQLNNPVSKTGGFFAALSGIAAQALLPAFLRGPTISALAGQAPIGPGAANQQISRAAAAVELLANRKEAIFYQSLDRLSAAIDKTAEKTQAPFRNLFQDIGSGQFLRDVGQRQTENAQTQRGQQLAAEFESLQKQGVVLGPNAQAIVDAVRRAGAGGGFSLMDLAHTDFSNMDQLSKYDFGGLAPLSGLTLIVK